MGQDMSMIIEARGLRRQFGSLVALDGLDLDIEPGRVVGLVGDNGAGKSTLLRLLLGLLEPTTGSVKVCGLDPQREGVELRGRLGYIPEDRQLYPQNRIDRILKYAAALNPRWDQKRAGELMERFGLDGRRRVRELSRGALAKLHFVLTLSTGPELLLLDEATGGIDAPTRRDLLRHLVDEVAGGRTTVIFASHVLSDVERVADEIVLLRGGHMAVHAPLDTLMARHKEVIVSFPDGAPEPPTATSIGALTVERRRHEWRIVTESPDAIQKDLENAALHIGPVGFEDLFIAYLEAS